MDHYKKQNSSIRMCMDYLMLSCFGIFTTVIPMQLFDILCVAVNAIASLATCCLPTCNKAVVEKISKWSDQATQHLTSLTVYQVNCIKYASSVSRLTYESSTWILLQTAIGYGWLDLPLIGNDGLNQLALIISMVLTMLSLINKLVSATSESGAL